MASITKRGDSYRVVVSNKGQRVTATFQTKTECKAWASQQEADIRTRKISGIIPNKTVSDVLDEYLEKVSPTKRGYEWEKKRIAVLKRYRIASVRLSDLDHSHVAKWRDDRLKDVSGSSVCRDWNLLSHAVETARKEWRWINHNPFKGEVTRPKVNPSRDKIYTDEQIEMICQCLGIPANIPASIPAHCQETAPFSQSNTGNNTGISQRVGYAFLFAIETGMRAGEIVSLTKDNVYERFVRLPLTKNGTARDVPLSQKAVQILSLFSKNVHAQHDVLNAKQREQAPETVFNLNSRQIDVLFRRARDAAGLKDYRFHDARRTALTRLAKIFGPMDLAKISGHRSLTILLNTYYAPSVTDLAERLNAITPATLQASRAEVR